MGNDRRPGESDAQYYRRLAREQAELRSRNRKARRGDPTSMDQVMRDDQYLDRLGKRKGPAGGDELSEMLGAWQKDIESEPLEDLTEQMSKQAARDLNEYRKTKNSKKRQKLAKKNKKAWTEAAKKNKNGCAVIAVALLGVAGGAGWAIFEAGSAIVSALAG